MIKILIILLFFVSLTHTIFSNNLNKHFSNFNSIQSFNHLKQLNQYRNSINSPQNTTNKTQISNKTNQNQNLKLQKNNQTLTKPINPQGQFYLKQKIGARLLLLFFDITYCVILAMCIKSIYPDKMQMIIGAFIIGFCLTIVPWIILTVKINKQYKNVQQLCSSVSAVLIWLIIIHAVGALSGIVLRIMKKNIDDLGLILLGVIGTTLPIYLKMRSCQLA